MSANPIDKNPTPKPTGTLEELFAHHLGEEAAVPPRPLLWDQLDNSLLIRQNETYRHRLAVTRWVAAASLLLASLAGTGWWLGRDALLGRDNVAVGTGAAAPRPATGTTAPTGAGQRGPGTAGSAPVATQHPQATSTTATQQATAATSGTAAAITSRETVAATTTTDRAAATTDRATGFGLGSGLASQTAGGRYSPSTRYGGGQRFPAAAGASAPAATTAFVARTTPASADTSSPITAAEGSGQRESAVAIVAPTAALSAAAVAGASVAEAASASAVSAAAPFGSALAPDLAAGLAPRTAALALAPAEALPVGAAVVAVPTETPAPIDAHRWHYGASYAAGVFNPNVNFSRAGIESAHDYDPNPAFGTNSPALTERAATEYRNNLRPGFSQRLALLATRHLRGHWSLSTGLEFSQATAHSASASAFVGEQLFDLGQSTRPVQTTHFRYRLASVPVEVRYTNPVRRGWSLYGRLGGVVSALLGVRSEVTDNPEATRSYSLLSAGTPYRRLLASVRGGAGAQFRAGTGKWALSAGPVADLGLLSLNAHPAQSYLAQSHPYTVGVEAAIEFGR